MKRILFSLLVCCGTMFTFANDVYLSASGNDTNDGLSSAQAVATLGKALQVVTDGGTINVSGQIYVCDDEANVLPDGDINKSGFALTKSITVKGDQITSGLVGFSEVTYNTGRMFRVNVGITLTLKNLTLKNGVGTEKAGAIHVNGGALVAENVIFEGNEAMGVNQPAGGAVQIDKSTGLSFKHCVFKKNKAEKGGAVYIQDTQTASTEIRFEACSFVENEASARGAGALFFRLLAESNTINIINCTFSGNKSSGNGGTISIYNTPASTTCNIVNSTIVGNIGRSGGGSGAGILVGENDKGIMLRIQNSIIEGNALGATAANTAEDLTYFSTYEPSSSTLKVDNSFIGNVFVSGARTIAAECYEGDNHWNYMPRTYDPINMLSGVDNFDATLNVYKLKEGAMAIDFGKATYLQTLNITTDGLGATRTFANAKCSAGAVEYGAVNALPTINLSDAVKIYQHNGQLVVKALESSKINLNLYAANGQCVLQQSAVGTELNVSANQFKGIYIAKVTLNGKEFTQKVVIK